MLVNVNEGGSGAGGGGGQNVSGNSASGNGILNKNVRTAFSRGDKASVSVRLRTQKSDGSAGGGGGKKRNRHSGDFSFFSSKSAAPSSGNTEQQKGDSPQNGSGEDKVDGGDWAYITFPNGTNYVLRNHCMLVQPTGLSILLKKV